MFNFFRKTAPRSDREITYEALAALKWNYCIPVDVQLTVHNGWIILKGHADWDYERAAAAHAVGSLLGVTGVINNIELVAPVLVEDVQARIQEAIRCSAGRQARQICVVVDGNRVILSGLVHSALEIEDARAAAWSTPGVALVEDHLRVAI